MHSIAEPTAHMPLPAHMHACSPAAPTASATSSAPSSTSTSPSTRRKALAHQHQHQHQHQRQAADTASLPPPPPPPPASASVAREHEEVYHIPEDQQAARWMFYMQGDSAPNRPQQQQHVLQRDTQPPAPTALQDGGMRTHSDPAIGIGCPSHNRNHNNNNASHKSFGTLWIAWWQWQKSLAKGASQARVERARASPLLQPLSASPPRQTTGWRARFRPFSHRPCQQHLRRFCQQRQPHQPVMPMLLLLLLWQQTTSLASARQRQRHPQPSTQPFFLFPPPPPPLPLRRCGARVKKRQT